MDTVDTTTAGECLRQGVSGIGAMERRHESLMEWAETQLGLEREYAEQVYALAEESGLEPVYAFVLIRCGLGVQELETPEQDAGEQAAQQAPPEWVGEDMVQLEDIALERRLRATFRRLRGHMDEAPTPGAAVDAFLGSEDVGPVALRPGGGV
jgi:hypothetical protein